jgi:nitrogen-specific signal transduction histidine kinase
MIAQRQYEMLFATLVHDVRQPLSTIENSAYCLQLLMRDAPEAVREQIRVILRQVDRADGCLRDAADGFRQLQNARDGEENFELTNSATALVT